MEPCHYGELQVNSNCRKDRVPFDNIVRKVCADCCRKKREIREAAMKATRERYYRGHRDEICARRRRERARKKEEKVAENAIDEEELRRGSAVSQASSNYSQYTTSSQGPATELSYDQRLDTAIQASFSTTTSRGGYDNQYVVDNRRISVPVREAYRQRFVAPAWNQELAVPPFDPTAYRPWTDGVLFNQPRASIPLPNTFDPNFDADYHSPEVPNAHSSYELHYIFNCYWAYMGNLGYPVPLGFAG